MNIENLLAVQPQDGAALFVDMNSFFASVEQQIKPHLRGRPVAVCPFVGDSTSVIAASIEAKRFGVKTGTRVPEARRLCPDIVFISDDPGVYRDYHKRLMAEFDQTRCKVLVKSIDEAMLIVPHDLRNQGFELAQDVKRRVASVGDQLKCSVGIASNMFLAKMATNLQKPDGLIQIKLADLEGFYSVLKLTDLHGVSFRTAKRLRAIGIHTPLDLYNSPYALLKQHFGVNGQKWYLRLRGYEVDLAPTTRRTVGHQTTVNPTARTEAEVLSVASQLAYKAATRLRRGGLAAKSVSVYVRYNDRSWWGRTYNGHSAFTDSTTFYHHVQRLLHDVPLPKPVRLVSVTAFDLIEEQHLPQTLFDPPARNERLSAAMDLIEERFGRLSIVPAEQLLTREVKDRIGFGNARHGVHELGSKLHNSIYTKSPRPNP